MSCFAPKKHLIFLKKGKKGLSLVEILEQKIATTHNGKGIDFSSVFLSTEG